MLARRAVGLDLDDSPRYFVELYLNGQRLPDAETLQATSTNRSVYQPGAERAVEKLRAGENCVRAVFYPLAEARPRRAGARSAGASGPRDRPGQAQRGVEHAPIERHLRGAEAMASAAVAFSPSYFVT